MTYDGRVQAVNVWNTVGFVLNGLVFMLIGLQLPIITGRLGDVSLGNAIWYGVLISFVLIITRMCCTIGAAWFTRIAGKFITVAERRPGLRIPIVFGWAGMRGVVSLAAALSIPVLISEGQAFPFRNVILVITFVVILVTLVLQGLTLPWLIRKMNIQDNDAHKKEQEQDLRIRKVIAEASLNFQNLNDDSFKVSNPRLALLKTKLENDAKTFSQKLDEFNQISRAELHEYEQTYLHLLETQRAALRGLNKDDSYDEELIRKYLSIIDLEETKLRELELGAVNYSNQ